MRRSLRSVGEPLFDNLPAPVRYQLRGRWQSPPLEYLPLRLRKPIREDLAERSRAGPGPSIWFLPNQTWFSGNFQRPQQMARALAEVGCPVVYHEPWAHQGVTTEQGKAERRFMGVRDLGRRLHLLRCPEEMMTGYIGDVAPDAVVMLWPMRAKIFPTPMKSAVIYEMVDDHSLFPEANETWAKLHARWVEKADVMVTTADDLAVHIRSSRPDALLLPNGVRLEDWTTPSPCPVPADLEAARKAPVVVGYYGSIAEWFDWEMWEAAAAARPDWAFVLIGVSYDHKAETITSRTRHFPNMAYLGPKPYSELPAYLAHFDVATIPFVLNEITHACSPVKLFEYMAGGKPIVTSAMREVLKYRSVLVADGPDGFVKGLDDALMRRDDPNYRALLQQEASANTWRSRAQALRDALEAALGRGSGAPAWETAR